jgi:uncharacterized protein (DUF2132 family)
LSPELHALADGVLGLMPAHVAQWRMNKEQPNNPLHGITLEMMLNALVEKYGWEELSRRIRINCFARNPSVKSSLAFLRKTPWARAKVEGLYSASLKKTAASLLSN